MAHEPATHAKQKTASSANTHELTLTIPWGVLSSEYQKVLQRVAKRVKLDGFRAGKVPTKIAEKMVDQPAIYQQALENILPIQLQQLLTDHPVEFIGQPELDPQEMEPNKDWKFSVRLAKVPTVKLGAYEPVVKKAAKTARELQAKAETERAEADKKKASATTDTPDQRRAAEPSPAELDDQRVRAILQALVEHTKLEIPEQLVRQEVNRDLQRLAEQLARIKMSIEQYLQVRKQSYEQLRAELSETAQRSWQVEFILSALADDRKLAATEADIDDYLQKHQVQDTSPESREALKGPLRRQKVIEWLLSV